MKKLSPLAIFTAGALNGAVITMVLVSSYSAGTPSENGEPSALASLSRQGYQATQVDTSEVPGWRMWALSHRGVEMPAYAADSSGALVVGGTLYDSKGSSLSKRLLAEHHRKHMTMTGLSEQSRWVDLSIPGQPPTERETDTTGQASTQDEQASGYQPDFSSLAAGASKNTPTVAWLADPTDPVVQEAFQALSPDVVQQIRFIPYPRSNARSSRDSVIAILEASFQPPAGQSDFVTAYRGGDIEFAAPSSELLRQALDGHAPLSPKASAGHPAEQHAYSGVAENLHLMDQIGVTGPQVFHPSQKGTSLTMSPLSDWMATQPKPYAKSVEHDNTAQD